jgi:hypothetical protein
VDGEQGDREEQQLQEVERAVALEAGRAARRQALHVPMARTVPTVS